MGIKKIDNSGNSLPQTRQTVLGKMTYEGGGLSNSDLHRLQVAHKLEEKLLGQQLSEYNEKIHLNKLIEILEESKKKQRDIKKNEELEFEFLSVIEKLGVVNDYVNLPFSHKILCKETLDVINTITNSGGEISVGTNSYFVAGSLHTFKRLYSRGILNPQNVSIKFGNGVNLQENIGILKAISLGHENYQSLNKFETGNDQIDNIHIHIGDNSSIAHGCNFYGKQKENGKYEVKLHTGKGVFLGINTVIGSGSDFGDNTVIRWGTKIGFNVKTGRNVIIGTQANIKDNVLIPDNCVILDGSHIGSGFEIIDFDDYKRNEVDYDMEKTTQKGRRNFVVRLSNKKEERLIQVEELGDTYIQMRKFNKSKVLPENKAFAVIDSILSLLNSKYSELQIVKNISFENTRTPIEIEFYSNSTVDSNINKASELYLQAYPADKVEFILKDLLYILKSIQNNEKVDLNIIKKLFSYPNIPDNFEEIFLGYNSLIGNVNIGNDKSNFIYESSWRKDENSLNDTSYYNKVQFARCIFHGPGDQKMTDIKGFRSCFHGIILADNSVIGEKGYPSTLNNVSFQDSIVGGRCTINNAIINHSEIGFAVILSATLDRQIAIEYKTKVEDCSTIRGNNSFVNSKIYKNTFIGEWPERETHYKVSIKGFYGVKL